MTVLNAASICEKRSTLLIPVKMPVRNEVHDALMQNASYSRLWMKVSNALKTQVPIIEKAMQGLPAIAFDVSL